MDPFSYLYGLTVRLRGWCFDRGLLASSKADVSTLCVGNLAVGGTGKSPLVSYLLGLLATSASVAMLSRGYGRSSKGYLEVRPDSLPEQVGDEPLMIKLMHPALPVAVCNDRLLGCQLLQARYPDLQTVILDDAFQYRKLTPTISLLLTTYQRPYSKDHFMPSGTLRDTPLQAKRAEAIIVTKCPLDLTAKQAEDVAMSLHPLPSQSLLFSAIDHGVPRPLLPAENHRPLEDFPALHALAAIARPQLFFDHVATLGMLVQTTRLRDHATFSPGTLSKLEASAKAGQAIVTTEKDAVRLRLLLAKYPYLARNSFVVPIALRWLFESELQLKNLLARHGLL